MKRRGHDLVKSGLDLLVDLESKSFKAWAQVIDVVLKNGGQIFQSLAGYIDEPQSINSIVETYSHLTTQVILNAKRHEQLSFVGGTFKIELVDDHRVALRMDAFFKSKEGKWIKKENVGHLPVSKILPEAIEAIRREKTLEFELVDPETLPSIREV